MRLEQKVTNPRRKKPPHRNPGPELTGRLEGIGVSRQIFNPPADGVA